MTGENAEKVYGGKLAAVLNKHEVPHSEAAAIVRDFQNSILKVRIHASGHVHSHLANTHMRKIKHAKAAAKTLSAPLESGSFVSQDVPKFFLKSQRRRMAAVSEALGVSIVAAAIATSVVFLLVRLI